MHFNLSCTNHALSLLLLLLSLKLLLLLMMVWWCGAVGETSFSLVSQLWSGVTASDCSCWH